MSDQETTGASQGGEVTPQSALPLEEQIKTFKSNYTVVRSALDHGEEPIECLTQMSEFIQRNLLDLEEKTLIDTDEEFSDWFLTSASPYMLKKLGKERTNDPQVSLYSNGPSISKSSGFCSSIT